VARDATEQTERGLRAQQETVRQFSDPFVRGDGAASHAHTGMQGNGEAGMASPSPATPGDKQSSVQGTRTASAH
jgi:hypothetical protein